jgi:hypothetical protein
LIVTLTLKGEKMPPLIAAVGTLIVDIAAVVGIGLVDVALINAIAAQVVISTTLYGVSGTRAMLMTSEHGRVGE